MLKKKRRDTNKKNIDSKTDPLKKLTTKRAERLARMLHLLHIDPKITEVRLSKELRVSVAMVKKDKQYIRNIQATTLPLNIKAYLDKSLTQLDGLFKLAVDAYRNGGKEVEYMDSKGNISYQKTKKDSVDLAAAIKILGQKFAILGVGQNQKDTTQILNIIQDGSTKSLETTENVKNNSEVAIIQSNTKVKLPDNKRGDGDNYIEAELID